MGWTRKVDLRFTLLMNPYGLSSEFEQLGSIWRLKVGHGSGGGFLILFVF